MPDRFPEYTEDRCSQRWPMLVFGLGMPVLVLLCTAGGVATGDRGFAFLAALPLFVWIFTDGRLAFQYWPIGIRIDGNGIRIGGVLRAERRCGSQPEPRIAKRKLPPPSYQCYHVFAAPWAGLRSLTLVTDRKQLRQLRNQSRSAPPTEDAPKRGNVVGFWLGMFVPPFTRAALVIDVDLESADFPEFRIQRSLGVATSQFSRRSSTWVVPTRHPDQLRTIVDQITNSSAWNARYWDRSSADWNSNTP